MSSVAGRVPRVLAPPYARRGRVDSIVLLRARGSCEGRVQDPSDAAQGDPAKGSMIKLTIITWVWSCPRQHPKRPGLSGPSSAQSDTNCLALRESFPRAPTTRPIVGGWTAASIFVLMVSKGRKKASTTDSWVLYKMRVPCSACTDWPRARAFNIPACSSTQVTPGYDIDHHLTREKHAHTHSACMSTAGALAVQRNTRPCKARRENS